MADNVLTKKFGPLKGWQYAALGGGLGLFLYLRKKKEETGEPKAAEGLVGSAANPLGGGESGGLGPGSAPGAPGEPGPVGAPGAPGELNPQQAKQLEENSSKIDELSSKLNVALSSATLKPAAVASKFPLTNPLTGQHYRIEKVSGKTVHVYADGHRVVVGGSKASRKASNNKHTARKESRTHAHPANPHHTASHAAPVAARQHARPTPVAGRVNKTAKHPAHRIRKPKKKRRR